MASSSAEGGGDDEIAASALPPNQLPLAPPGEEPTRRGFQKLWTDADEITVLEGFWEFTSRRGTARAGYQHDTGPFFDEIHGRLRFDFTRNQLVEKLRRLKKKYRSTAGRMNADKGFSFRSPHEKATFEIARKIWNPVFKRGGTADPADTPESCDPDSGGVDAPKDGALDSDHNSGTRPRRRLKREREAEAAPAATPPNVPNAEMIEQTMRSCFSPLFNEILLCAGIGHAVTSSNLPLNPLPLNSRAPAAPAAPAPAPVVGEKWKQQQILELEVYLKRLELLHEHIKLTLEELKSKGKG